MAKTFMQMVAEARAGIPLISPQQAQAAIQADPTTLVIEVRDARDIAATGLIPGAARISAGMLALRADQEMPESLRDPRLQERGRPIILTCGVGLLSSLGAKTLKEMGFANVSILDGGTQAWKEAGLPVEPAPEPGS